MSRLSSIIATTPIAPAAVALCIGIAVGHYIDSWWVPVTAAAICLTSCMILLWPYLLKDRAKRARIKYQYRQIIWPIVCAVFCLSGYLLIHLDKPQLDIIDTYQYSQATVEDIRTTTSGDVLTVTSDRFFRDTGKSISCPQMKMLVYTGASTLSIGDVIQFRTCIRPVELNEYNSNYLYTKGIDAISHTCVKDIRVVGHDNSLHIKSRQLRDRLSLFIDDTGLSQPAKGFIRALLLGDKSDLNLEHKEDFKSAGIAHILSLSGLHIGIVLLILGYLLLPLDMWGQRNSRLILMAVGICAYALLTGMNAPVMRATLMSLCLLGALLLQRPHTSINALSVAACIILCLTPRALFDVGCQLSFVCTLAIIVCIKLINEHFDVGFKKTIVTAIAIPVSAALISWPIMAYHFHNFATLFLPLNIVAIPLLPIYMFIAIIYLLLSYFGLRLTLLEILLDKGYQYLADGAHSISSLSTNIDNIYLPTEVALMAIMAALCLLYTLRSHSSRALSLSCLSYLALILMSVNIPAKGPEHHINIPADYYGMSLCTSGGNNYRTTTMPDGRHTLTQINGYNLHYLDTVYSGHNIDFRQHTILILGKNFKGEADDILASLQPERVILSARLYPDKVDQFGELCSRMKIPVHHLSDSAFVLTPLHN
ncbi:MAG: ComEC/Rec2 family competence protein [Muribaculaceae bacterium]|nr:ComEC/Rec2 family competence protein [Muribaculaceae bacterium]